MFEFENSEKIVLFRNFLWPSLTSDDLRRHFKSATVMKMFILLYCFVGCKKYKKCFRKKQVFQIRLLCNLQLCIRKYPQKHTLVGSLGHFKGPTVLTINLYCTKYINVHIAVCIGLQFLAHWYFKKLNPKSIDAFFFCLSGLLGTHRSQNEKKSFQGFLKAINKRVEHRPF